MTRRRIPGWVLGVIGVCVAALFWFLWLLLGPVDTHQHEIDRLRHQARANQTQTRAQIDALKAALAQANAERAAENKPPIVITTPSTPAPTAAPAPTSPPVTAPNQKHCTVPDLVHGGCLVQ